MKEENKVCKSLIGKMSLEQKIGALLTLRFAGTMIRPHLYDCILKYQCGGLRLTPHARTFGSYVDPKTGKSIIDVTDFKGYKRGMKPPYPTAAGYQRILLQLQELAMSRPLGLPLHFSFDQEGGTSADFNFGGVNLFPKPMGIRATGDPKLAYEVAKAVSRQSRAVGFSWIHSPVLDINVNPDNPEIYTRAYSDRVDEVVEYALEACRGFKEGGLIATGKHFPGRGDSAVDAHFEIPTINVDKETMLNRELLPYKVLIEQDLLPSIMIAHSIYPAIDPQEVATVSKKVLTGLLRDELGFDGVITTDSMTMGGIALRYGVANACALALEAGADLVLMKAETGLVGETVAAIRKFVEEGRITEEELNKKVLRVLSLKYEYGLFTHGGVNLEDPEEVINDRQIVQLAKTVARRSVLVAAKRDGILPLAKEEKVLVIEQINKTPNDLHWHPGILYRSCLRYNHNLSYLETKYNFDQEDRENIKRLAEEFDTIIVTNFYMRGSLSNNEAIRELLLQDQTKRVIVVTNTPYRLSIPEGVGNVIVTFATTPENIRVVAGTLFGVISPEGEWPVANGVQM